MIKLIFKSFNIILLLIKSRKKRKKYNNFNKKFKQFIYGTYIFIKKIKNSAKIQKF